MWILIDADHGNQLPELPESGSVIYQECECPRLNELSTLHNMPYSTLDSTWKAIQTLIDAADLPWQVTELVQQTTFTNESSPILPCPFRQLEAAAALKAIEAAVANAIGKIRFGYEQDVTIDLQHATLFLLSAYLATVDGMGKQHPGVKEKLKSISPQYIVNGRHGFPRCSIDFVSTDVRQYVQNEGGQILPHPRQS